LPLLFLRFKSIKIRLSSWFTGKHAYKALAIFDHRANESEILLRRQIVSLLQLKIHLNISNRKSLHKYFPSSDSFNVSNSSSSSFFVLLDGFKIVQFVATSSSISVFRNPCPFWQQQAISVQRDKGSRIPIDPRTGMNKKCVRKTLRYSEIRFVFIPSVAQFDLYFLHWHQDRQTCALSHKCISGVPLNNKIWFFMFQHTYMGIRRFPNVSILLTHRVRLGLGFG